jgi:hypothetical protein
MPETSRLTDTELAEIRRRRLDARASLACDGIYLTAEQRIQRIIAISRAECQLLPADE